MCSDFFFFFKQKTAYEMSISDWSSDVCSSDLGAGGERLADEVVDVEVRIGDVLALAGHEVGEVHRKLQTRVGADQIGVVDVGVVEVAPRLHLSLHRLHHLALDRKSTRLNSSH